MGRPLRYLPPGGATFESTTRTLQGYFLLPPTPDFAKVITGILARAQQRYPVRLHAVCALSNHLHMLGTAKDAQVLAQFMCYANSNIAREAGRAVKWQAKLWGRRYRPIILSEEEAVQVDRLRYLLSQGVKENLVASPRHWPGLHSALALIEGQPLRGLWYDRTLHWEATRRGESVEAEAFIKHYELELEPLPCWAHLEAEEYRERVREMVEDIEAQAARRIQSTGIAPLGAEAVLRQSPFERPAEFKSTPSPVFHAASKAQRRALSEAYGSFVKSYRQAASRLRAGDRSVKFPAGCFPPRQPFVRADVGLPSSRAGPPFAPG